MKSEYSLRIITKADAKPILVQYHYLSNISKGFKSGINYGLIKDDRIVGVCIFTGFPVPELFVGMFGLPRNTKDGFYELSRLCLTDDVQKSEHNLASWFTAKCIKDLRNNNNVRAILSYADSGFHQGVVYQALGFSYYGKSAIKKDFFKLESDGSYRKVSRGSVKGLSGEWRKRNQKHRYVKIYDKSLKMKWKLCDYNKK